MVCGYVAWTEAEFLRIWSNPAKAQIDPKNDKIAEMKKDLRTVPRVMHHFWLMSTSY